MRHKSVTLTIAKITPTQITAEILLRRYLRSVVKYRNEQR